MDKSSNVNYLLNVAGRGEIRQRIREVVRVNGVDRFKPCDDPNVITLVRVYDDEDAMPESRKAVKDVF